MSTSPPSKADWLPLAVGLLTAAAGLALASSGSSQAMILVGAVLLVTGIVVAVAALLGQSGRAHPSTPAADGHAVDSFTGQPVLADAHDADQTTPGSVGASAQPVLRTGDWLAYCTGELVRSFNTWFEQHDAGESYWPAFDRWMRDGLNQAIRARRVRCFRTVDANSRLVSLTNELEEPLWPAGALPGLVAHVLSTGRPYVKGSRNDGDLIDRLVATWCTDSSPHAGINSVAPQWLLPIRLDHQTIGLVLVGELPDSIVGDSAGLGTAGSLLCTFWRHVAQADALSVAEQTDRSSGVLNRVDLTSRAERIIAEASADSEPVVLIALAVEGVRRLNDLGHWELRDHLMREIGTLMHKKMRSDDLIGRFSEDRFVAVLRRLDLPLGELISRKLLAAVQAAVHQEPVLEETVRIRCGLTDAGADGVEAAVARAFQALHEARREDRNQPLALSRRDQEQMTAAGAGA